MKNKPGKLKAAFSAAMVLLIIAAVAFLVHGWMAGRFDSVETMREYIASFGPLGPLVLTLIQALKVIIPLMPGFVGCFAGTGMFGLVGGFLCNYIGLTGGSIVAFLLARKYGVALVKLMVPEEKYRLVSEWVNGHKSFTVALMLCFLLPMLPDDVMCYLSGLTGMPTKRFVIITVLTKPWLILAYCIAFSFIIP